MVRSSRFRSLLNLKLERLGQMVRPSSIFRSGRNLAAGARQQLHSLLRGRITFELGDVNSRQLLIVLEGVFLIGIAVGIEYFRITRIKNDTHVAVAAEMVHQKTRSSTLVEVGGCLLEERVNSEFKLEILYFDLLKAVRQRCGVCLGALLLGSTLGSSLSTLAFAFVLSIGLGGSRGCL